MYAGYGYAGRVELWNNQRVLDYLAGDPATFTLPMRNMAQFVNRRATCPGALSLFCDPPAGSRYVSPVADDAPWYDAQVPESADFAGLFVEEIVGFDSVVNRSLTEAAIYGGALGPLKLGPRQVTVTGYLFAETCCAAEYGLHWLTEALIGSTGCDDCGITELFMLKCCPPDDAYLPDPLDYARLLLRVGLLDGPKVVDRFGTCCNDCGYTTLKVQFTLASELPYIFSELSYAAFQQPFGGTEAQLDFYGFCDDCPEVSDAKFVPDCGPPIVPRPEPFRVVDLCYCDPWCAKTMCATVVNPSDWNSATTVVQVFSGSGPLKNLKITAYANPAYDLGVTCPCEDIGASEYWKCREPCNVMQIAAMPSGATLTIDSRTRTAVLQTAGGGVQQALGLISSPQETGFEWFDVPQCNAFCFIVTADCTVSANATVTIATAAKFHASGG